MVGPRFRPLTPLRTLSLPKGGDDMEGRGSESAACYTA